MVVLEALDSAGTCVVIEKVGAGKLVGWSWLFPPYIWHFDARATKPTCALFFYGTILREYCAKDPSLGFELFKRMSQVMVERLQSARARLLSSHSSSDESEEPGEAAAVRRTARVVEGCVPPVARVSRNQTTDRLQRSSCLTSIRLRKRRSGTGKMSCR